MHLLAIDPGNSTGLAFFEGYELTACRATSPEHYGEITWAYDVIIEEPQIYVHGHADPNDLLKLAQKVGQLRQIFPRAGLVKPRTWKGQLPKPICHARGMAKLSGIERAIVNALPRKGRGDVLDAVCMGLWKLKR